MKRLMFARQTDPSDLIPMPGLCRDFGRGWEGNEKDGGVECLDADDPHWCHLLDDGALVPVPLPQGADKFAPLTEFIGPVRKAFEAFGLAKDDEETWGPSTTARELCGTITPKAGAFVARSISGKSLGRFANEGLAQRAITSAARLERALSPTISEQRDNEN